jgi:sulfur relay protein TusB/DsrH
VTTLHLAYSADGLERCHARTSESDEIVLMGDATYAHSNDEYLVLEEDALARGLVCRQQINYERLVELTVRHQKVISWP